MRDILAIVKSKQDFTLKLNCVSIRLQPQLTNVVMPGEQGLAKIYEWK